MKRYLARLLLTISIATAMLGITSVSRGQAPSILISAGTHISSDSPNTPFVETFLAINPQDATNLIATSIAGGGGSRVYASRDGGRTWQPARTTTRDNPVFDGLDPVVYFDAKGIAFFATGGKGFLISRSTDGGFTWEVPITVPGGNYDRQYLAIDNTGGRFKGRMYAGGAITVSDVNGEHHQAAAVAYSTDSGRTFSSPVIVTGDGKGTDELEISDLLVTPDGKLVVPFVADSNSGSGHIWSMVSEDGGLTFSAAHIGPSVTEGEGFRMLKSLVAPRAAIDLSNGQYRGRIYFVWDDFDGKRYLAKVTHSSDTGKTWSSPVVVNDNPDEGDPANPAIAVNAEGVIGIAFNDRRDDPANTCFRLYFSASVDGGETFLPNVRASDHPTCPMAPRNRAWSASSGIYQGRAVVGLSSVADRWPNGGDTQGLVAGPDGVFHSAWINGESGVMQLWAKDLTVDRARVALEYQTTNRRANLSSALILNVSEPNIDPGTHTISMKVRLENPSSVRIPGPFSVVLGNVRATLRNVHALNSENGLVGRGAVWNFTVGNSNSLEPQQKSDDRVLRWGFSGDFSYDTARAPFSASFLILGAVM